MSRRSSVVRPARARCPGSVGPRDRRWCVHCIPPIKTPPPRVASQGPRWENGASGAWGSRCNTHSCSGRVLVEAERRIETRRRPWPPRDPTRPQRSSTTIAEMSRSLVTGPISPPFASMVPTSRVVWPRLVQPGRKYRDAFNCRRPDAPRVRHPRLSSAQPVDPPTKDPTPARNAQSAQSMPSARVRRPSTNCGREAAQSPTRTSRLSASRVRRVRHPDRCSSTIRATLAAPAG
jgi:hypothetical protein